MFTNTHSSFMWLFPLVFLLKYYAFILPYNFVLYILLKFRTMIYCVSDMKENKKCTERFFYPFM